MGEVARSQLIRLERSALAATVGLQNALNEAMQLLGVRGSRLGPPFILIKFVDKQSCKCILAFLWHL